MTDLRKAAEMALEALEKQHNWMVANGGTFAANSKKAIQALRQALAQSEHEPVGACVTCGAPKSEWLVDAVNTSQERVDETAKGEHEPWPSVQCVCGGTIYFKYTPPVSDYHEGWEEGFKAAKGKHEPVGFFSINDYGNWEENENGYGTPLYTAPPKREWIGLTREDKDDLVHALPDFYSMEDVILATEAKLKEKNA